MSQLPNDDLAALRRELRELLSAHCFSFGDFVLASGQRSSYFYNGKLVTLSPRGADLIVSAVSLVSDLAGEPVPAFIVRAAQKDHGKQDLIAEAYGRDGEPLL